MVRTVKEEDFASFISKIMRTRQLRSEDIRKNDEKKDIFGVGEYECEDCGHGWISFYSWITVDFKEKRICKRWLMKCRECEQSYKPTFSLEEIEKMIEIAIKLVKGERISSWVGPRIVREWRTPPHEARLCEKCKWGAERCWEFRFRYQ